MIPLEESNMVDERSEQMTYKIMEDIFKQVALWTNKLLEKIWDFIVQ